ncbi:MAG: hypothetical protein ACQESE_04170 [Nanobdellota archaeon]
MQGHKSNKKSLVTTIITPDKTIHRVPDFASSFDIFYGELSRSSYFIGLDLQTAQTTLFPYKPDKIGFFNEFYNTFMKSSIDEGKKILLSYTPYDHSFFNLDVVGLNKFVDSMENNPLQAGLHTFSPNILKQLKEQVNNNLLISEFKNPFNYQPNFDSSQIDFSYRTIKQSLN